MSLGKKNLQKAAWLHIMHASGDSHSGKGICGRTKLQYTMFQGMAVFFAQNKENLGGLYDRKTSKNWSGISAASLKRG